MSSTEMMHVPTSLSMRLHLPGMRPGGIGGRLRNQVDTADEKITVFWGKPERHEVPAECLARFTKKRKWVIGAPAKDMPDPIPWKTTCDVSESSPVWLIGHEVNRATSPPSFADISATGIITKIYRTLDGQITKTAVEHSTAGNIVGSLALTEEGGLLGYVAQSQANRDPAAKATATIQSLQFLSQIDEPEFTGVRFRRSRGTERRLSTSS